MPVLLFWQEGVDGDCRRQDHRRSLQNGLTASALPLWSELTERWHHVDTSIYSAAGNGVVGLTDSVLDTYR